MPSDMPTWISCRKPHGGEISTAGKDDLAVLGDLAPRNLPKKAIAFLLTQ